MPWDDDEGSDGGEAALNAFGFAGGSGSDDDDDSESDTSWTSVPDAPLEPAPAPEPAREERAEVVFSSPDTTGFLPPIGGVGRQQPRPDPVPARVDKPTLGGGGGGDFALPTLVAIPSAGLASPIGLAPL